MCVGFYSGVHMLSFQVRVSEVVPISLKCCDLARIQKMVEKCNIRELVKFFWKIGKNVPLKYLPIVLWLLFLKFML